MRTVPDQHTPERPHGHNIYISHTIGFQPHIYIFILGTFNIWKKSTQDFNCEVILGTFLENHTSNLNRTVTLKTSPERLSWISTMHSLWKYSWLENIPVTDYTTRAFSTENILKMMCFVHENFSDREYSCRAAINMYDYFLRLQL